MTDAAPTPPERTHTGTESTAEITEITVESIEAKLAAGEPVEATEVRWLLDALRAAETAASADPSTSAETDAVRRPTREELIAEFHLGPDPSPDMLAYLADYVVEREAEAAAEAADGDTDS